MQWTSDPQANFTTNENGEPWLPVNPNYITRNVDTQTQETQMFRKLSDLKQSEESLLPPLETIPTIVHSVAIGFSSPFGGPGPHKYEWY
ncbi:hypothetical protein JTE90_020112 [Oedothorax gibbosus]|uniref:Uncharacterized protein n=1 Tax=Oedothorax gibbosus TaxID=931172 RepID=A0AAV6VMB9_9ARAC|nr:hypothetical protein JTE90_020112 [Oedothorax gibbosus]